MNSDQTDFLSVDLADDKVIEILQADSEKSHEAFRLLYDRYYQCVEDYLWRMIQQRSSVAEILQDCFVRLYRSRHSIDKERSFKPYLMKIAHNSALSFMRSNSSSVNRQIDSNSFDIAHYPATESALDLVQKRELGRGISNALQCLEPRLRAVLVLRHVEKLKFAEIAEVLDCTERTVRNRLAKAAINFARSLQQQGLLSESDSKSDNEFDKCGSLNPTNCVQSEDLLDKDQAEVGPLDDLDGPSGVCSELQNLRIGGSDQ